MASTVPQRRAAAPRPVEARSAEGANRWLVIWVILALVVGTVIGAVFMRARYARLARQVIVSITAGKNTANITKDEFYRRLERGRPGDPLRSNGVNTLQSLVMDDLYILFAKSQGVAPKDADVARAYANMKKSQPNYKQQMAEAGLSPRDVRERMLVNLSMTNVLVKGITVSDADARSYYQRNIAENDPRARFFTPETTHIAVIVTPTREQALKAMAALQQPAAKWGDVVSEYSIDTTRSSGGMMPPVQRGRGEFGKPQYKAVSDWIFSIPMGSTDGPRPVLGKWWIVRCFGKDPERTVPFDVARDDCVAGAKLMKGGPKAAAARALAVKQQFADFIHTANVQVFWSQYKKSLSMK